MKKIVIMLLLPSLTCSVVALAQYQAPSSGPLAQMTSTITMTSTLRKDYFGYTTVREEGRCAEVQSTGQAKQVTIPAGRPVIVERAHYASGPAPYPLGVLPTVMLASALSCGFGLRFVPIEGEAYEARLQVGQWGKCTVTLLRVGTQGRTSIVEAVTEVPFSWSGCQD